MLLFSFEASGPFLDLPLQLVLAQDLVVEETEVNVKESKECRRKKDV